MALLDKFRMSDQPSINGKPQWEANDEAEAVINVPAQQIEQRREIDGVKVLRCILDLGTREKVRVFRTRDPNTIEFRWIDNANLCHRYIVTFANVQLQKMQF